MSLARILNYTYDDYKQWEGDWELIDGMAVAMAPAPLRIHQNITTQIIVALQNSLDEETYSKCEVLYSVDWKVDTQTVLRPDIVLSCDDESEAYLSKAPKIIVEILSPSTAKKDEIIKFDIYQKEGVQYYILVYPDDLKAKVFSLKDGRYIKVGDFTHKVLNFDDIECDMSVDFAKVFAKFR